MRGDLNESFQEIERCVARSFWWGSAGFGRRRSAREVIGDDRVKVSTLEICKYYVNIGDLKGVWGFHALGEGFLALRDDCSIALAIARRRASPSRGYMGESMI
jgi:hypothetical protein